MTLRTAPVRRKRPCDLENCTCNSPGSCKPVRRKQQNGNGPGKAEGPMKSGMPAFNLLGKKWGLFEMVGPCLKSQRIYQQALPGTRWSVATSAPAPPGEKKREWLSSSIPLAHIGKHEEFNIKSQTHEIARVSLDPTFFSRG